jgi:hypothetical protein
MSAWALHVQIYPCMSQQMNPLVHPMTHIFFQKPCVARMILSANEKCAIAVEIELMDQ